MVYICTWLYKRARKIDSNNSVCYQGELEPLSTLTDQTLHRTNLTKTYLSLSKDITGVRQERMPVVYGARKKARSPDGGSNTGPCDNVIFSLQSHAIPLSYRDMLCRKIYP